MAKKPATQTPWIDLEQQAVDAYREWPIWLVLREKELTAQLPRVARQPANRTPRDPADAAPADPRVSDEGVGT